MTINGTISNQTHYFFSNTSLPDGEYPQSVTTVKDMIAGYRGEQRTQTFKDADNIQMIPGATFIPNSSDQYTSGYWLLDNPSDAVSSTLPVLYINTEGGTPVTSKETYVNATYYLHANNTTGCSDIGSKETPLDMQICGRGNYTWSGFDKKPYRIKLTVGQKLAGLNKAKHFVLMAGADDELGYLRNPLGFELSKRMGMAWTPDYRPIEVVLNGNYIGLYFLTENIRVDKDRVDITEQMDLSDDDVTGGWLVEVDNYDKDPHISVNVPDKNQDVWITYHSPEVLSATQKDYLQNQFNAIRDAVYCNDRSSTEWETLIDKEAMARVYVTRELMQDEEGFHGSFYMYNDCGTDKKWEAGPVWDFGNSFRNPANDFIWNYPNFECYFIDQIYQFPRFQETVRNVFGDFFRDSYPTVDIFIDSLANTISQAALADHARWGKYGTAEMEGKAKEIKAKLKEKVDWLVGQWGTSGSMGINATETTATRPQSAIYDISGRRLSGTHHNKHGIVIKRQGNRIIKIIR